MEGGFFICSIEFTSGQSLNIPVEEVGFGGHKIM
jgi:hypothetical protein